MNNSNIVYKTGDLFSSNLPALGHGVNLYGVMGSGIAPIIKARYPLVFAPYKKACDNKELTVGNMLPVLVDVNKWVFNLASQNQPGPNAQLGWLESSLTQSFIFAYQNNLEGFAIPRIGAGIGGLKWVDVIEIIERVGAEYPTIILEVWSLPDADK